MRTLTYLIFLLVGACVATQAPSKADQPYTETTISEIKSDPWAWHGKTVRVTGTFDECLSLNCHFCEEEKNLSANHSSHKKCMGISFYDEREGFFPEHNSKYKRLVQLSAAREYETLARFTTSTIDAIYDASCSNVPEGKKSGDEWDSDVNIICTDRASQLDRARIVQTHIRRPATAGVINMYGKKALASLDRKTAAAISAAFQKTVSAFSKDTGLPDFVFVYKEDRNRLDDYGITALGGACKCIEDKCLNTDWPKREGDTWIETPSNPYICWQAELVDGVWRFPLQ